MLRVLPCAVLCWLVYYGVLVCCAELAQRAAAAGVGVGVCCDVLCCTCGAVVCRVCFAALYACAALFCVL